MANVKLVVLDQALFSKVILCLKIVGKEEVSPGQDQRVGHSGQAEDAQLVVEVGNLR